MKPISKIMLFSLIFAAIAGANHIACKKSGVADSEKYPWQIIDETYTPKDYVEEFIKTDAETKGALPVYIRNYGKDDSILRKFVGANFARPSEAQLNMMYKGLDDWKLVGLKYKNEMEREVQRTVLYISINGVWKVGDNGKLGR